ncbi:Z-ring formation inhibitor MciZ [Anaerobacillus sp. HL2]|nr:Z-ring formation inhibitor MciZ [Anaerobacillus sp. HL2]
MKIYIHDQKITLVGKAWQIKYMLKKYMKKYTTVKELIDSKALNEGPFYCCYYS